jgi:uncharacterized membrane protein
MRTFITELRAETAPPRRRQRAVGLVFRWASIVFALASLVLDARLAYGATTDDAAFELLLRAVLVELEVYLVLVVVVMTVRILTQGRDAR